MICVYAFSIHYYDCYFLFFLSSNFILVHIHTIDSEKKNKKEKHWVKIQCNLIKFDKTAKARTIYFIYCMINSYSYVGDYVCIKIYTARIFN